MSERPIPIDVTVPDGTPGKTVGVVPGLKGRSLVIIDIAERYWIVDESAKDGALVARFGPFNGSDAVEAAARIIDGRHDRVTEDALMAATALAVRQAQAVPS